MQNTANEKQLSKILSIGAAVTTIFLVSGSVTDPVNTPKLLALGFVGCSAITLVLFSKLRGRFSESRTVLALLLLFIASMLSSVAFSNSPLSQNIYGSYGRNNGMATYIFLAFCLGSTIFLREKSNFDLLVKALFFAGLVNTAYCLWVILFGDFVGWTNPYGNILGTLGNPNFIGAFLGFFFSSYLAWGLGKSAGRNFRISMLIVLPITGYEIINSHAIQGRVVAALGSAVVGFFYLKARFNRVLVTVYSFVIVVIGGLSVAGALQKGPLTSYIYKTSVSLRGQYWLAGWNTGQAHPWTGVGMDAFGDWYRRSRDVHAITLPGVNTVVNAAHNVWMDMFAFGGWPLFVSYLGILACSAWAIIKQISRAKTYDATFVALLAAWLGYQTQSIISINQIGLAIWGWVLSGALIAYEVSTRTTDEDGRKESELRGQKKSATRKTELTPVLALFGGLIGLLIALPPLTADAKWRSAQLARTLPTLEATMQSSIFNPQNSTKFLNNIQTLEASNLFDLSHKYALQAVNWNPEAFELWKVLYLVKNSTVEEKALALKNMKRLDPLNPDVTATQ